jgi:GAF domain-containing protein
MGPSTSWFDRDELRSLFKSVKPATAPGSPAPAPAESEGFVPPPPAEELRSESPLPIEDREPVAPAMDDEPEVPEAPAPEPEAPPLDPAAELTLRQAESLLRLARGQASRQALGERLWEITEAAADVLQVARASVWTFDGPERTRIACRDLYTVERDLHEEGGEQGAGDYPLYFAALHSERPIVTQDARTDPRTHELVASAAPPQARLECPIFAAGRMAGILRLEHEGGPRRFGHEDERFAATLANLLGLALEVQERREAEARAAASDERQRRQQAALTLLSRSDALTRGRIEDLLTEVTETAVRELAAERSSVWVYAPDFKSLFCLDVFERTSGRHQRGQEIREETAPGYFDTLRAGGRLATEDAREDPRLRELVRDGLVPPGFTGRLEAPLHLFGRLAGRLWVERADTPRPWREEEERFAEALAGFVALGIATSERRKTDAEVQATLSELSGTRAEAAPGGAAPGRTSATPESFEEDLSDT